VERARAPIQRPRSRASQPIDPYSSVVQQQGERDIEALFDASTIIGITTTLSMKQEQASFRSTLCAVGHLSLDTYLFELQRADAISRAEQTMLSNEILDGSIIGGDVVEAFRHLRALALREADPECLRASCVDSLRMCFEYRARGWCVTGRSSFGALCQYSLLVDRAPQDPFTHCVALVVRVLMHSIGDRR
jgi:hypothetical protein